MMPPDGSTMGFALLNPSDAAYAAGLQGPFDADQQGVAGSALSARRDMGRQGGQFRAVLGPCREGRAVPVRALRPVRAGAHRFAGIHRRGVALLSAGGAAGPVVRLTRLRALRTGRRSPL